MSIEVDYIETRYGKETVCSKCGSDVQWKECWNCDEGRSHHDCGEDTCCCRDPQPNVKCDICNGEGGWWICITCVTTTPLYEAMIKCAGKYNIPEDKEKTQKLDSKEVND